MRDTGFEPNGHGEKSGELTEDQLLACFSGDGLVEELGDFAGVEMCLETPDAGLTKAGEFLSEIKCAVEGGEGIVICALRTEVVSFEL